MPSTVRRSAPVRGEVHHIPTCLKRAVRRMLEAGRTTRPNTTPTQEIVMKQTFSTRQLGAVAATLGMALALGGTSYAVAQTGTDIVSRGASVAAEPAGTSPVIGKS